MKTEHPVSNCMVSYGEPFELTLSCQPGFDNVSFHIPGRVEWIFEQGPSDGAVTTAHSAQFVGGPDELFGLLGIDSECYGNQDGTVLGVWFDDEVRGCARECAGQASGRMVEASAGSQRE